MNKPRDMTNPFATLFQRIGVVVAGVVDVFQFIICGHSPILIAPAAIILAVDFSFLPGYGAAIVGSRPHQAGGQVFDGLVVIGDKSL
jgi:hypothetical protein